MTDYTSPVVIVGEVMNKKHLICFFKGLGTLMTLLSLGTFTYAQEKGPINVVKDHHDSFIDSIGDYLADEFYSSKDEVCLL